MLPITDKFFTQGLYSAMQSQDFKPSGTYMGKISVFPLAQMSHKRSVNEFKIKLLYNGIMKRIKDINKGELFEDQKDIMIFVSGGGFLADFERMS